MTDIPAGWPCASLPTDPPSVQDRQSYPTADDVLPQILALTPRGAAWGTDGLGDGGRASPVQRSFWRAIAAWVADVNTRDFDLATQVFPSALTWSLPDWENEYGLPDACLENAAGTDARIASVRAKFGAVGGASPAYFVCLARSIGYDITIEEPTQFLIDASEVVGDSLEEDWFEVSADPDYGGGIDDPLQSATALPNIVDADEVSDITMFKFWIVHVTSLADTYFRVDEGVIAYDPLEGFLTASDLECLLQRDSPTHTELVFSYDVAA